MVSRSYNPRTDDFRRLDIGLCGAKPHFSTVVFSDIHIGSLSARPKRTARTVLQLSADLFLLNGDILEGAGLYARGRKSLERASDLRAVSAFQTVAAEAPVRILAGNHDPYPFPDGRDVYKIGGLTLGRTFTLRGADGRRFLVEHGDAHDRELTGGMPRGFWSSFGDRFISATETADALLQTRIPSLVRRFARYNGAEDLCRAVTLSAAGVSLARAVKDAFRDKILERMSAHRAMLGAVMPDDGFDGRICGHTHMEGFWRTPEDKLVMNSGDSTFYPKALVEDKNGFWGHLSFMPRGIVVVTESRDTYALHYRELGLKNPYLPHIGRRTVLVDREGAKALTEAACGGTNPAPVFYV